MSHGSIGKRGRHGLQNMTRCQLWIQDLGRGGGHQRAWGWKCSKEVQGQSHGRRSEGQVTPKLAIICKLCYNDVIWKKAKQYLYTSIFAKQVAKITKRTSTVIKVGGFRQRWEACPNPTNPLSLDPPLRLVEVAIKPLNYIPLYRSRWSSRTVVCVCLSRR